MASATCAAASICRERVPAVELPRVPSLSDPMTSPRELASAGRIAKARPVTDADAEREQQHRRIDGRLVAARQTVGEPLTHHRHGPVGEQDAGGSTEQREHQALGEHLPDQPPAGGADRHADRDFALPRGRPREHQVRDVGAGDQQHAADRAEQHEQRPPGVFRHQPVVDSR